jgi:hypothetical protein
VFVIGLPLLSPNVGRCSMRGLTAGNVVLGLLLISGLGWLCVELKHADG